MLEIEQAKRYSCHHESGDTTNQPNQNTEANLPQSHPLTPHRSIASLNRAIEARKPSDHPGQQHFDAKPSRKSRSPTALERTEKAASNLTQNAFSFSI